MNKIKQQDPIKSKNAMCRTADEEPRGIPLETILQCDHARRGRQRWCRLGCCFYVNAPSTSLEKENIKTPKGISSLIRVILPPSLITREVNEDRSISHSDPDRGGRTQ